MFERLGQIGFTGLPDGDAWVMAVDLNVAERHLNPADETDAEILRVLREKRDESRARGFETVRVPMPKGVDAAMKSGEPVPVGPDTDELVGVMALVKEKHREWEEMGKRLADLPMNSLEFQLLDRARHGMLGGVHYVDIAKACHEANKAYCQSIGDTSQVPWDSAPDWQKESAIKGVLFRLRNPDSTPEDLHNSWCEEKLANGWMYGEVKDAEKKTHPCLVGYTSLPKEQRFKDELFGAIVNALRA